MPLDASDVTWRVRRLDPAGEEAKAGTPAAPTGKRPGISQEIESLA